MLQLMMTRRQWLSIAPALPAAAQVYLSQPPQYANYSRALPDYLRRLTQAATKKRDDALAKLTTPEAIKARQAWARDTFWKLAGAGPVDRTPLNVKITGSLDRPGYKVENLVYESRPDFFVTANLYTPKSGKPPYPA